MRPPRAPVAAGTLPGVPVRCNQPRSAKATASFASPSKKSSSKRTTLRPGRSDGDGVDQRQVLRAAAGQDDVVDRLREEAPVRVGDRARGEAYRGGDDVLGARLGVAPRGSAR